MKIVLGALAALSLYATAARADDNWAACSIPQNTVKNIQAQLAAAVASGNGGIFKPNLMWSAVVDRSGTLCSVAKTGDAWPGSRAIAIAKAETANDFSNAKLALSTANLYGPTQPGGSLYGLNESNPFNPFFNNETTSGGEGTGVGRNPGGIISFGGGVALYVNGQVIGGLGVSGDTSCADHSIAYKMRHMASLDTIPGGVGPGGTDNIAYYAYGSNLSTQDPSQFAQPHCLSTDVTP